MMTCVWTRFLNLPTVGSMSSAKRNKIIITHSAFNRNLPMLKCTCARHLTMLDSLQSSFNALSVHTIIPLHTSHLMIKPTKMVCVSSEDSDQPGRISLGIRPVWSVLAVRMKKSWVLSYPLSAQGRHWSAWADAQGDLSLRWAHMPFCWFCHEAAHINQFIGKNNK